MPEIQDPLRPTGWGGSGRDRNANQCGDEIGALVHAQSAPDSNISSEIVRMGVSPGFGRAGHQTTEPLDFRNYPQGARRRHARRCRRAIADERAGVLGELLERALDAFVREP